MRKTLLVLLVLYGIYVTYLVIGSLSSPAWRENFQSQIAAGAAPVLALFVWRASLWFRIVKSASSDSVYKVLFWSTVVTVSFFVILLGVILL